MRRLKRRSGLGALFVASVLVVAISLTNCAGTPTSDSMPRPPRPTADIADGLDRVLDYIDSDSCNRADSDASCRQIAAFVAHYEDLYHYAYRVLPAWRGE